MVKKKSTKSVSPNAQRFAGTVMQELNTLAQERNKWETGDYKKANEGLYALLAQCLKIYQERFLHANDESQKELRSTLVQRLQADGIRVVKTSTTLSMLARFVFNSDRKRAHGYSYVLIAGMSHDINPAEFANWVMEQGGIEEIKRRIVQKPETIARQAAVKSAIDIVNEQVIERQYDPIATVQLDNVTGSYALLLARPDVDGHVNIVGSLSDISESLFNTFVKHAAKKHAEHAALDEELGAQINREKLDLMAYANPVAMLKQAYA